MTAVTSSGFQRTRLDERLASLKEAVRAIFGPDINLDPDTIDGQMLGIFAESISNLDQLAEDCYQSFNPSSAAGLALSRLVQLNGIRRIAGAHSTASIRCVGTDGTIIPAGSLVSNPATGVTFETLIESTIPSSGQIDINVRATEIGAKFAPAGTLTKIDTPIYGWQTVTNPIDAVPGRNEETDLSLRARRASSTATPAQAVLDGIYGAIANIPDVRQCRVFENDQDTTDSNGLPPHSIYCVVEQGSAEDIAAAIWRRKTVGTTMVGNVSEVVSDSQGNPHTVKFSRPSDANVYVVINLTTRPGWPTDGEQRIKNALVEWGISDQSIGEELIYSRLFSPINTVPGFAVDSLYIGTTPAPSGTANIGVAFDGLARIDSSRITVNVTTP